MCILICTIWEYTLWVINYMYFPFKKYVYGKQIIYGFHLIFDSFMKFYSLEIYPLYGISECTVCVCINVCLGEWIAPTVTGDRPPPIYDFTLTSVTNNTAVLFGGFTTNEISNNVYIINFSKASVVSVLISII